MQKDQWINNVFNSMQGSDRAKPNDELFASILNAIDEKNNYSFYQQNKRWIMVAASFLIIINTSALIFRTKVENHSRFQAKNDLGKYQNVVTSYNIYE